MARTLLASSMVLLTLVAAACSSGATPAPSTAASAPASAAASPGAGGPCARAADGTAAAATVTIADFAYDPGSVTVNAGESVAWTNEDTAGHTASMTDGSCDTSTISQGATVTLTFNEAGTYTYKCNIHPTMTEATIEVTG